MSSKTTSTLVIILGASNLPRLAWTALLQSVPGLKIGGSAASPEEVVAMPPTNGPTSILIDFSRPIGGLVKALAAAVPGYGLLCLVDSYDLDEIVALLQAGATGCLIRDSSPPELAQALIATGRQEIVLPPALASRALVTLARGEVPGRSHAEALTDRENDVLTLLAQGLTNKDIAQSLFLSVRTVEAHLRNIYAKLDVNSRTEAALWAVQHGFES